MANENGNLTIYELINNSDCNLWKSAAIAAMKIAFNIKNESITTDHHQERLQWAQSILANPDDWVRNNRWNILQDSTVLSHGNNSTDNEIEASVAALIPA